MAPLNFRLMGVVSGSIFVVIGAKLEVAILRD
jgi:hypothetical protein